jgi:hypothetical protein
LEAVRPASWDAPDTALSVLPRETAPERVLEDSTVRLRTVRDEVEFSGGDGTRSIITGG